MTATPDRLPDPTALAARRLQAAARFPFRPNGGRAALAAIALGAATAANAAHGVLCGVVLGGWDTIEDSTPYVQAEVWITLAMLASLLITGVLFIAWMHRAFGNAHAAGLRSTHAIGWAIGGWFVPLLNLVRPYQIAAEMWRHAGPERAGPAAIAPLWWAGWLLGNVTGSIGTHLNENPDEETAQFGLQVLIASDLLSVLAGVMGIVLVRRLTAAHAAMVSVEQAKVFD
ncbi:MAG: DUF4328 domain-containing protein [Planctomycetes bacterium]|nr:DUF4328 domain-containing protein [Planctomycetota bacterium]